MYEYFEILVEDGLGECLYLFRLQALLISGGTELLLHEIIFHPYHGLRGQHVCQPHIFLFLEVTVEVGTDLHLLQDVAAPLAVHFEM